MVSMSIEQLYELFIKAGQLVSTDTRKLIPGSIFFSLKGANFNANEFAAKAIAQGCSYAVVDDEKYCVSEQFVLVPDVLTALQGLARFHRNKHSIPFLAITGSNGKTTNKELINAVLSKKYKVLATQGNLNNHIGVPLTLLRITNEHQFAIIEMGANHQKEIEALCAIADPDFGLITNIGKAHLEGFGGIEGVKKGKGELYTHLKAKSAKAFVNGDDDVLIEMAFNNDKITYGCKKLYDVIGKDFSNNETVSFKYTSRYGEKDFKKLPMISTQITGVYNFVNCLAAACVGEFFKVSENDIKTALEEYVPDMNRSQLVKTKCNTIILDAYNANPESMKAAIDNFGKYPAEKKLTLLGDMFELGEFSSREHEKIIELLDNNHLDNVILVGAQFKNVAQTKYITFDTTEACKEHLRKQLLSGYTILIKGSRGMKMEILQEVL